MRPSPTRMAPPYPQPLLTDSADSAYWTRSPNPYEELSALSPPGDEADQETDAEPDDWSGGLLGLGFGLEGDGGADGGPDGPGDHEPIPRRAGRRRRRRFAAVSLPLKVVILLAAGLAFLFVVDRWAVLYAENKAEEKLKQSLHLQAEPEVHIRGFPFLTQLLDGRLGTVDATVPDLSAGRVSVAQVKGEVHDVRIVGDLPSSVRGAVVGRMRGEALLRFDDLSRELGTSQVRYTRANGNSVLARGELPVAGRTVLVRAEAHVRGDGDREIAVRIDGMRLAVADLLSYRPGKDGGPRLARPTAERISRDAANARALLSVPSIAKRLGVTPAMAERARRSDESLHRITGSPHFVEKLCRQNVADAVVEHPGILRRIGIDPALIEGLTKLRAPQLADKLSLEVRLPKLPGHVWLEHVAVGHDGIRAAVKGTDVPFGGARKK
ncbi:LmeA family phospholipid-binding protein [Wenjunlia tyrosinilytica]|uniref:DUF2993 domain-containing protein n=1 Tax=Wenjunlia tyrosinilytica TaxID=1544741 RepID=A0A917ZRV7_9ACTN|nr:DUF2993 domain-containing protein [Wenjunlia tyrosinilytica]GGO88485.1 hypothetical protein GCM10012280_29420 [Wenjunlia tyrosinilytica]